MKKIILVLIIIMFLFSPVYALDTTDKIVYEKDNIIYLMDSDGTNEVRLTEGIKPIWSPDGEKILFLTKYSRFMNQNIYDISIINADGSGETTLIKKFFLDEDEIQFTPEGKIIFSYWRVCNDKSCELLGSATEDMEKYEQLTYGDFSKHIGMISITGSDFVHLTKTSDVVYYTMGTGCIEIKGGKHDGKYYCGGEPEKPNSIYDDEYQYCYQESYDSCSFICMNTDSNPIVSPDGKKFAYFSGMEDAVIVKDIDGSNPVNIFKEEYSFKITLHDWSPDGKYILLTHSDSVSYIYNVQSDGTGYTKLARGTDPQWSPDGKFIVYKSGYSLKTMNNDGTDQKTLNKTVSYFDWAPDGKKFLISDGNKKLDILYLDGITEPISDKMGYNLKWSPKSGNIIDSLPFIGNSKQSSGFAGLLTVLGLIISLIIASIYFKKSN